MSDYNPGGILQWTYKGTVYAAFTGMFMRVPRNCQLCASDDSTAYYSVHLCDGTRLVFCQNCFDRHSFTVAKKICEKFFSLEH